MILFPPLRRQVVIAIALVLLLLLAGVQTFRLAGTVLGQLDELAVTPRDRIQWNLTQTEVELMQLQLATAAASEGRVDGLAKLRQRFDVFYSRVETFRESPLYVRLLEQAGSFEHLTRMRGFLGRWVAAIDGPDDQLKAVLPEMARDMQELHTDVRAFVLLSMQADLTRVDQRRDRIRETLLDLGVAALVLIATLAAGVYFLWRLYVRLGRVSRERKMTSDRLQAMVTSALDAILVVGGDGRLLQVNGAATRLFGKAEDCLEEVRLSHLIRQPGSMWDDRMAMSYLFSAAHSRSGKRLLLEGQGVEGDWFPAELSVSAVHSDQEEILVAFVRDISDRIAAETDLRRARDDALAGERAKSNLLTVMSHEMRTPLNGVLGALDLLEAQGLNAEQHRFAEAIRVSGDLLLHHVNDVLELSRIETGWATPEEQHSFDLEALVTSLVDSQQAVARKNGTVLNTICRPGVSTHVRGNRRMLQKALLNLIGNALKFTREGEVTVELDRLGRSAMVEFRVSDTGRGIAEADLERIFDAFVTIDASFGRTGNGAGLGLAITRKMVETMGGEIGAESVEGEGSLFWIRLPLPVVARPETALSPSEDPVADTGALRILVVEDNEINRLLLVEMLRGSNHHVVEAEDGYAGLAAARADRFDLVFMDISMPGMDGVETAHRIRQDSVNRDTPIIAVTAHAGEADHQRFLASGFVQVVSKPYSRADLAGAISDWATVAIGHSSLAQDGPISDILDPDVLTKHRREFRKDISGLISELDVNPEVSDPLLDQVHKLAGSAAMLGFDEVAEVLNQIENNAPAINPDLAKRLAELIPE